MHGNTKHGHYRGGVESPTVVVWRSMINRCTDPEHQNFKNYGGRGISFDVAWLDFSNFLADMGERPEGYALDRIDPDGHYVKWNCQWACAARQQHTRRDAKLSWEKIERIKWMRLEGFTQQEIATEFGVNPCTISRVLNGRRWQPEKPVVKPEDAAQKQ